MPVTIALAVLLTAAAPRIAALEADDDAPAPAEWPAADEPPPAEAPVHDPPPWPQPPQATARGTGPALAAGPFHASLYGLRVVGGHAVLTGTTLNPTGSSGARFGAQVAGALLVGETPAGLQLTRLDAALLLVLADGPVHVAVGAGVGWVSLETVSNTRGHDTWFLGAHVAAGVALGRIGELEPFLELRGSVITGAELFPISALVGIRPARP